MLKNNIAITEETNGRKISLLFPALSLGTAMTLLIFLEAVFTFIVSSFEDILHLDGIIQNLLILLLTQFIGVGIVIFFLIPLFKVKQTGFYPISKSSIGITTIIFFLTLSTTFLSSLLFTGLFAVLDWDPQFGYSEITITAEHISNPFNIILFLVTLTIGAALFEEMVCRRLLIPLLEDNQVVPFAAVLISSIIFAMAHLDADLIYGNFAGGLYHTVGVFLLGMMLGMAYILTRNVIFPVAIHTVTNFMGSLSILFMLMENEVLLTIHSLLVLSLLVIGLGITGYFTWKYYRGSEANWISVIKEKSEIKISHELIKFMIVGLTLIYLPNILKIAVSLLKFDNNLSRILLLVCFASILIVLVWLVRKIDIRRNDRYH